MVKKIYNPHERCTYLIAADLLCVGEHTARRRLTQLRKALDLKPHSKVVVGEFCRFYNLNP